MKLFTSLQDRRPFQRRFLLQRIQRQSQCRRTSKSSHRELQSQSDSSLYHNGDTTFDLNTDGTFSRGVACLLGSFHAARFS